ncbi:MAG: hypothetical protein A2Z21_08225 [Candidatus Fraserbacteria bacterium RBG_16_55_9]|uniref:CARDB domain-containing protein n=1 Tax=Fraserbacteria sp. (strain RBG_16_55_9) TaxID=1817864 RepID=A0A1F5UNL3_FRAXR|nr:MAG: hypothetical protein A2Z21_08225 [Candidatus Fraserbacteria bacterium RBG_16_55_9]
MAAKGVVRVLKILAFVILAVGGLTYLLSSSQPGGGKPELHPTTLILDPASPVDQGRLVNVLVKFENSGVTAASEFKVEFFIRLRPTPEDPPSWTSFAVSQRRGLSSDEQEVQAEGVLDTSNPGLIPAPGIYEIRVVIDSNDQIPETDETNNELIASLLIQPSKLGKADLRPQALTFEPTSPIRQSEMVFVAATVVNTGDKDAGPFDVSFTYCRITEGQTSCPTEFLEFDRQVFAGGLPKSGAQDASASLQTLELGLETGIYLIKVSADPPNLDNPSGQIAEQDEANNELIAVLSIQGPELHAISISFNPPLPRVGDTIKVTAVVENSGQGTARNMEVAFYVDGAEFARPTVTLEEGGTALVEGFLKTPDFSLGVGIHVMQIVVDPNHQIAERDETNNELRTSLTLQPSLPRRPELHPKSLVVNPRSPIELHSNLSLTITSEAVNTGEVEARGFLIAFFYRLTGSARWVPLPCTTNCTVSTLPPGTGIVAEGKLSLLGITAGSYEVRVLIDPADAQNPDGQVKELDESNNEMKSALTLLTARKPDLFIDPIGVYVDPSLEIRRGTTVNLSADVLNIGEQAASVFTIEFSLRRLDEEVFTVFARRDVNGLGIGERIAVEVQLSTASLRPGFYELQVVADPENRISELDEGNNVFTTGLDPRGALFLRGPDLAVLNLQIQQPSVSSTILAVSPGQQVPLVAQVTNIGVEATGAFDVEFCRQRLGETSCVPFGERTSFPGLGIGVVVQVQATLDTSNLTPGSYVLQVVVDPTAQGKPAGQVEEENEQNNIALLPLEILGQGGTPGGGDGADLTALSLTLTPELAQVGDLIQVRVEVGNIGRSGSGPFRVVFFWRKTGESRQVNFAGFNVSNLAVGARQFLSAELDTSLLFRGSFEVIVVVDFNDDVSEPNESNNRLTKPLRVN